MKKVIWALAIAVMILITSCTSHNTTEENNSNLHKNILDSVEKPTSLEDLFTKEETSDTYKEETAKEYIVYRTRTGKKYHASGCQYLSQSCIEITLEDAKYRGLKPCSVCQP